ncbi:Glycoside hydrolase family 31 protein [Mycena indigotica]|uniref:Glycoside hydrolase family 31 protein n=1 Tax=Mycena indigotica TaxID=2126181 RepID=A0A8H6VPV7_9AGAR|nr:Glycoside hydrolase family 31 protein [Mycena indigotica]KAF7289304.1 Glycoside hydrolase family 31 protein [Mycena indigotica]
MPLPKTTTSTDNDDGWQKVSGDWWRIKYSAVSWTYSPEAGEEVIPIPKPRFSNGLFLSQPVEEKGLEGDDEDSQKLNDHLVGLKGALDALEPYEIGVGFYWPESPLNREPESEIGPDKARVGGHVVDAKEQWDELVQGLTGGLTITTAGQHEIDSDDESALSVHRSTSTHSSMDLTDSDRSVSSIPMPSTPRARRNYPSIQVKTDSSPSRNSDRSRLNAAASIFVPSPPKPKLPPRVEPISFPTLNKSSTPPFNATFVFPSLDVQVPPVPSVKITKDEQGFYSEAEAQSTTVVPSFLQGAFTPKQRRTPSSKTRAIVDKLKSSVSQQQEHVSRPPQIQLSSLEKPRLSTSEHGGDVHTPPAEEDSEGWIGGDDVTKPTPGNPKTRRTRELFLALTRRRSNSSPTKPTLVADPPLNGDEKSAPVTVAIQLPSPASTSSLNSSDNDGWLEGSSTPAVVHKPRPPKKAKRPSASGIVPGGVQGANGFIRPNHHPPAYFYPPAQPVAVPVPYAAAYMHQMQFLQMQQMQQHMRRISAPVAVGRSSRGASVDWSAANQFAVPIPAYPIPVAVPVPLHHPPPVYVPRAS